MYQYNTKKSSTNTEEHKRREKYQTKKVMTSMKNKKITWGKVNATIDGEEKKYDLHKKHISQTIINLSSNDWGIEKRK